MHGCGNDYVFVDTIGGPAVPEGADLGRLSVALSDRHFGVGGDGLIVISRSPATGRLGMRMFNADGSEGEMCGNGMRCLAAYVFEQGYVSATRFEVDTLAGIITPEVNAAPGPVRKAVSVTADQGPPREVRPALNLDVACGPAAGTHVGTFVSMGNPHFVVVVPDIDRIDLAAAGRALENHPYFPNRANIEFVEVLGPGRERMRIWERGSGITMSSGTGASASVVATATAQVTGRKVTVVMDGGELEVDWTSDGPVLVTGPAVEVFRTTYRLEGRV